MNRTALAPATASGVRLTTGDRVRVASGVFGRLCRVRSTAPGHVLVQYDRGGRELIDPSRRAVWVIN